MYRLEHRARNFGSSMVLAAAVAAGGLGLVASSSQADTIGPYDFDQESDFTGHFTIKREDPNGAFNVDETAGELHVNDSGSNGNNDPAFAVVEQSGGQTTFNASQITTRADLKDWVGSAGNSRFTGPTVLGTPSTDVTYAAVLAANGSSFTLREVFAGKNRDLDSASTSVDTTDSSDPERIEIEAIVNQATGTADLTARLYTDGNFTTPAQTLTAPNRDLSADGTSAIGEAGLTRFGDRNGRAEFDRFEVEFTPVPEPGSLALIGVGGLLLLPSRQRKRG